MPRLLFCLHTQIMHTQIMHTNEHTRTHTHARARTHTSHTHHTHTHTHTQHIAARRITTHNSTTLIAKGTAADACPTTSAIHAHRYASVRTHAGDMQNSGQASRWADRRASKRVHGTERGGTGRSGCAHGRSCERSGGWMHVCTQAGGQASRPASSQVRTQARTHARTHTSTHARTHTRTHARTHTRMLTLLRLA